MGEQTVKMEEKNSTSVFSINPLSRLALRAALFSALLSGLTLVAAPKAYAVVQACTEAGLDAALAAGGCHAHAEQPPKPAGGTVAWHQLGSWSGRGSLQTESFASDTGALRVRWETTAQPGDAASAATGAFRITAHSAISGRPL